MEATPKGLDVTECFKDLINIDCVEEIHDFHVWSISVGKMAMSGHIRSANPERALSEMTIILRDKYDIYHSTIQVEKSTPGEKMCCENDSATAITAAWDLNKLPN